MRYPSTVVVYVFVLASAACSDPVSPRRTASAPSAVPPADAAHTLAPPHATGDQQFIAAAEAVAGFGGFYFDEDGNPTVYLRNPSTAPAVDAQLRAMFLGGSIAGGRHALANNGAIRYRAGRYDFKELAGFRAVAERLLDRERTAVSIDVDEVNNRVTLAVSDVGAQQRLVEAIRAVGVPEEAFVVQLESPHVTAAGPGDSLISFFHPPPIPGGVLINDGNHCTLGFTINWNGRAAFVTASHCTHRTATLQNSSRFGQPTFNRAVAVEVADPGSWQHDCYWFENVDICRYSDAAVIRADTVPNSAFQVGYIARTLASGSLQINQSTPRWEVIGKKTTIYAGEWTDRIGVETGWRSAQVAETCFTQYITTSNDGTRAKFWCQYKTYGSVIGGDSGGPVAIWTWCNIFQENRPNGTPCTYVAGIATSRNADNNRVIFSPISGIETDLGTSLLVLPANQP